MPTNSPRSRTFLKIAVIPFSAALAYLLIFAALHVKAEDTFNFWVYAYTGLATYLCVATVVIIAFKGSYRKRGRPPVALGTAIAVFAVIIFQLFAVINVWLWMDYGDAAFLVPTATAEQGNSQLAGAFLLYLVDIILAAALLDLIEVYRTGFSGITHSDNFWICSHVFLMRSTVAIIMVANIIEFWLPRVNVNRFLSSRSKQG